MDCSGKLEPKTIISSLRGAQRGVSQLAEQPGILPTGYVCCGALSFRSCFLEKRLIDFSVHVWHRRHG
jgi:hypothetical protein